MDDASGRPLRRPTPPPAPAASSGPGRCRVSGVAVMMRPEEQTARDLAARLERVGVGAEVVGGGVHWHVEVGAANARSARIDCFWYERVAHGLMLGMNPSNGRSALGPRTPPYEGPEYLVRVSVGGERVEDGRSRSVEPVVAALASWTGGGSLEELALAAPFLGFERRAMVAVAGQLDPRLRVELCGDPAHDLWVYGARRSLRIRGLSCAFFVGQAQVAFADALDDLPGTAAAWLIERCRIDDLPARGVSLERHAAVIEEDPARWHWLHVLDRGDTPGDVLSPLAPLLRRLAQSPIARRYYTFSSLNRLCFSASSHYPWVGDLPLVVPTKEDGVYALEAGRFDLEGAVGQIEMALAACPVEPFFGTARDLRLPLVFAAFERQGSGLRPALVQHEGFFCVEAASGARCCRFTEEGGVTCVDVPAKRYLATRGLDDAVALARDFLEQGASLDAIAADPRVVRAR